MILQQFQAELLKGNNLSPGDIPTICDALLDESIPIESRANFLRALHQKGETTNEIAAFVKVLLARAIPLPFSGENCLDVCGTGGDRAGLFNISTAVMFVAAACGARVVKQGNRGVTSNSGGADVLEALGVRIDLSPTQAAIALEEAGCCFLFAPHYHPSFKTIAPVRTFLANQGSSSIFNILGPLLNPVRPAFQLSGVFNSKLLPTYIEVFRLLGRQRAWAIHGETSCGLHLDEVSPTGATRVVSLENKEVREFLIHPKDLGIQDVNLQELIGGDAAFNADLISGILSGKLRTGARTIVQLNAAAALVVAGIAKDLPSAWDRAGSALDDGSAHEALSRLRACA